MLTAAFQVVLDLLNPIERSKGDQATSTHLGLGAARPTERNKSRQ